LTAGGAAEKRGEKNMEKCFIFNQIEICKPQYGELQNSTGQKLN
jgi:hypothetical protein